MKRMGQRREMRWSQRVRDNGRARSETEAVNRGESQEEPEKERHHQTVG